MLFHILNTLANPTVTQSKIGSISSWLNKWETKRQIEAQELKWGIKWANRQIQIEGRRNEATENILCGTQS